MKTMLKNIKILDLTRLLPGPFGTCALSDLGAQVIKVESSLEPDWARALSGFFNGLNRGKQSISLNLKHAKGKEIFFRLVKKVDIVCEQFRPGVLDKLGVGFEECKKHNPRLVFASLSGYGASGPYADKAGHDLNYISLAGIAGATGTEAGELAIAGVQIGDQVGGLYLAIAILAGLNHARTTGQAIRIDVSIFESALSLVGPHLTESFRTEKDPAPGGMELSGFLPNYHLYRTADNRWISLGPLEGKFWSNFCKAVGKPDWELRLLAGPPEYPQLKQELAGLFRSRPLKDWEDFIAKTPNICLEPVRKFSEVENDPHVKARGTIQEIKDSKGNTIKTVRSAIRVPGEKPVPPKPAPEQGEDTGRILKELGYSETEIAEFKKQGAI
jgi:crotonobetainyl-CoA:carnitine CoA-transferase CaiB-like acyl-CoA transferase